MEISNENIRAKFGDDYVATAHTFRLGIGIFFSSHIADRYRGLRVLETCTGGGFCTISLAKVAAHVITVEIDREHRDQACANVARAGLQSKVTFVPGDVMVEDPWFGHCRAQDLNALVSRSLAAEKDVSAFLSEQSSMHAQGQYFYGITGLVYVGTRRPSPA
jgi:16S rRNA G966 N2-methylase RsmD